MAHHYRKRHKRLMAEMNVVPYIDVMLVLLVIFMVTAPMMSLTQGVEVNLPQVAVKGQNAPERDPIVVSVDQPGTLYLSYDEVRNEILPLDVMVARMAAVHLTWPDRPILVRGDAGVPHGRVVELMALLKDAGIPQVGLVIQPVPSKQVAP